MKQMTCLLAITSWLFACVCAGDASAAEPAATASNTPSITSPRALALGPNQCTWEYVTTSTTNGQQILVTNRFIEIRPGMNRWAASAQQWVAASDEIEVVNGIATASRAQYTVSFAPTANDPDGTVDLVMPGKGQKHFRAQCLGLAYTDKTGRSVFIAETGGSRAQVVGRNELWYPAVFGDSVRADLVYRTTLGSLAQDIVLRERLPTPADIDPGLDENSTRVEIWTRLLDPIPPITKVDQLIPRADASVDTDQTLEFAGAMQMGLGRAFSLPGDLTWPDDPGLLERSVPVAKMLQMIDGVQYIIESVPYREIKAFADTLPPRQVAWKVDRAALQKLLARNDSERGLQSAETSNAHSRQGQSTAQSVGMFLRRGEKRAKPVSLAALKGPEQSPKGTSQVARVARIDAALHEPGLVLDWVLSLSDTIQKYVFEEGVTYYISGPCIATGSKTVFEPGSVIKFAPTNSARLTVKTPIEWQGTALAPVWLTARDDSTVGTTVSNEPLAGYYADVALEIDALAAGSSAVLNNVRIAHARTAISCNGAGQIISNAELTDCQNGIRPIRSEFSLNNVLLQNVLTNFNGSSSTGRCDHVTVNVADWFNYNNTCPQLFVTRSLLLGVTNTGNFNGQDVFTQGSADSAAPPPGSGYTRVDVGTVASQDVSSVGSNSEQAITPDSGEESSVSSAGVTAGAPYDFSTAQGPHHRVVETIVDDRDEEGNPIQRPSRYVEVGTGLNYLDSSGAWQPSVEAIMPHPEGAAALAGYYKVVFTRNLKQSGAIRLITPEGKELRNHPLGLYYVDRASGRWVKLSGIQNSVGQIVGANQVLYRNVGDSVKMDISYTYQRGQFHADWILREAPPSPVTFGLSEESSLEAITEFVDAPEPKSQKQVVRQEEDLTKRAGMVEPDVTDVTLDFGGLMMVVGQAYPIGGSISQPVAKQWFQYGDRRFLSERIDSADLAAMAAELPGREVKGQVAVDGARKWPPAPAAGGAGGPMERVGTSNDEAGLVLDYTVVGNGFYSGYTFPAGTYYVTGSVMVTSGTCSFSSGAILKLANSSSINVLVQNAVPIVGGGATFTCSSDNSIGETIAGSSGVPSQIMAGGINLYNNTIDETISGFTFKWLREAVHAQASNQPKVTDTVSGCIFSNCGTGVGVTRAGSNPTVNVTNPTFCNVTTHYYGSPSHSGDIANNPPNISSIPNTGVNQDSGPSAVSVAVSDLETPAQSLIVTASSSNSVLLPNTNLWITGTGSTRAVNFTPTAGQWGKTTNTVVVVDGSGCSTLTSFVLTVNALPSVLVPPGTVSYTVNGPPVIYAATATVSDPDSLDLNGGTLTVDFLQNGESADRLSINNEGSGSGQIGVSGGSVTYGGAAIGTFTGGTGLTPLVITFNSSSTPAKAQALVRNLTYASTSPNPGQLPRNVRLVLTDGDGGTSAPATKTINIGGSTNSPPVLSNVPSSATIPELALYTFTAQATDPDLPPQTLTFSLVGGPSGASIGPNTGVFNWTPTEAQGPGDYTFQVRVTDGVANTDASIILHVTEVNSAPSLANPGNKTVGELASLTFTLSASDPDLPANTLIYSIVTGNQSGMTLNSATGAFSWTPTEAQGPGTYNVTFRVTDNGTPPLSADQSITITVNEVNRPPALVNPGNKTVGELANLAFTLSASDPDVPANTLTYSIASGNQSGMALNSATGALSWTPTEAQGPATYNVTFRVTDNGTPALSADQAITITVSEVNTPPVANSDSATVVKGASVSTLDSGATSVLANDTDVDLPPNPLQARLVSSPSHGTVTLNLNGTFLYTHDGSETAADSFTYKVNDGTADGNTATVSISVLPSSATSVITISSQVITYTENDAPILLDPGALVADPTQTGFVIKTITVDIQSNGAVDDRLGLYNGPYGAPGEIAALWQSQSQGYIYLGQEPIGTFTRGDGLTPFTITLTRDCATDVLQTMVRKLRFWNVSDNPTTAQRLVRIVATDPNGRTSEPATKQINVVRVNDPPTVSFSAAEANLIESGRILIDPGATVTDPDSANFNGGRLSLECLSNALATDRWGILSQGQISFDGTTVTYGGQVIGTASGGSGSTPLVVTFNSNCSPAAAQALVGNLTYATSTGIFDTSPRTIRVTVSDGVTDVSPLLKDLVAYWTLDEPSGTRADSLGALPLSDHNGVSQAPGKIGNAARFRRSLNQYLSHPDCPELAIPADSWTYAAWVCLESRAGQQTILSKNDGTSNGGFDLYYDSPNSPWTCIFPGNKFAFTWQSQSWTGGWYLGSIDQPLAINLRQWYFLVIWLDETTGEIARSVNDQHAVLYSAAEKARNEPGQFTVGAVLDQNNAILNAFDGRIDEIGFWRRCLTSAERTALYNIGTGRPYPLSLNSATKVINNGDPDGDGLSNSQETILGTNPSLADTNGNSISDGDEDFDGDGLPNEVEFALGTDPLLRDTNGNGVDDNNEDADGDLLPNGAEVSIYHSDPLDPYSLARAAVGSSMNGASLQSTPTQPIEWQARVLQPVLITTNGVVRKPDQLGTSAAATADVLASSTSTQASSLESESLPTDSQHIFAADSGSTAFKAYLYAQRIDRKIRLTLTGGEIGKPYDIYLRHALSPIDTGQTVYYRGTPGQTIFDVPIPPGTGYFTAALGGDTDSDGLPDGYEVLVTHTSPLQTDTDSLGLSDALRDVEGDRLTSIQEFQLGTDPRVWDTDSDGMSDGTDDFDGDGLSNFDEFQSSTNPTDLTIKIARPAAGTNLP